MTHLDHTDRNQLRGIAIARVQAGASARRVDREFGLSYGTTRDWCVNAGVVVPRTGPRPRDYMQPVHTTIHEMLIEGGHTISHIAAVAGCSRAVVYADMEKLSAVGYQRSVTLISDNQPVGRGCRITLEQRLIIAQRLASGWSHREIARLLQRSQSTISREIARNSRNGSYDPYVANAATLARMGRPKLRKLDANPALRARVVAMLNRGVSPQQVSRRLSRLWGNNKTMTISHEAIYQSLYVQAAGSLRQELKFEKACRTIRRGRKPRSMLAGVGNPRGKRWTHDANISLRPAEAADRAVPGHWEGDLIIAGDGTSALITLVERSSRFVMIHRLGVNHTASSVNEALIAMTHRLKDTMDRTISTLTWDQGVEMAKACEFEIATGVKVFFADPHSPWQRPSNERMNRDIREYFPKGTNFSDVSDDDVAEVETLLNNRPRVVLDGLTPREVLCGVVHDALIA